MKCSALTMASVNKTKDVVWVHTFCTTLNNVPSMNITHPTVKCHCKVTGVSTLLSPRILACKQVGTVIGFNNTAVCKVWDPLVF